MLNSKCYMNDKMSKKLSLWMKKEKEIKIDGK